MSARSQAAPRLTPSAWSHSAVRTVELVSGAGTVKVRPTSLARAIVGGHIPEPLSAIAALYEYEGIEPTKLSDEDREAFEDFKDWLIADCVIEPKVTQEFVHQPQDPKDVGEHMPADDRLQLWRIAVHADLPDKLGLMALANFRPGSGSAGPVGNGSDGE